MHASESMPPTQDTLEARIASALATGDTAAAATLVIDGYGDEIRGYLHARLRNPEYADEVFSLFAEDLWRGLHGLTVRTSLRAYAYALARNAAHRYLDREVRVVRRRVPLSDNPVLLDLVVRVRTRTSTFLRTESRDALARLREKLSEAEQALLVLRIDRGLDWRELAEVLDEDDDLERASARMRKRFELVKKKLRRLAQEEGLLS